MFVVSLFLCGVVDLCCCCLLSLLMVDVVVSYVVSVPFGVGVSCSYLVSLLSAVVWCTCLLLLFAV